MTQPSAPAETFLDHGPYGTPLFTDPSARALRRVGVVDIGSNSVRLVIFDGATRSPAYFFNEKVMAGLGQGVAETGRLNPEGRERALRAMHRFAAIASGLDIEQLHVVATAAMREASDGPEFRAQLERETGVTVRVIDGPEEARLSAQGVLLGWPGASGLVCDIGGSSMELARIDAGAVGHRVTSPLGPQRLTGIKGGRKGLRKHIDAILTDLVPEVGSKPDRLYLVGGSWRAIAKLDMELNAYPLQVLHEYRLSAKNLRDTLKWIEKNSVDAIRTVADLSESRASLLPLAGQVLSRVIATLKPREIAVSAYGLREGLLYEQMSQELRDRDPLLESCRFQEVKDARTPGFGDQLYRFIEPLFSRETAARKRIIRAACLLHDVSWRAHPDYRHEVCFDYATRANMGGMTHTERVYLGMALLHRYKNSAESVAQHQPMLPLLTPRDLQQAEVLGKAMRFGAMFSTDSDMHHARLHHFPKKKVLQLSMAPQARVLFGEAAQGRLKALANALGAEVSVKRAR